MWTRWHGSPRSAGPSCATSRAGPGTSRTAPRHRPVPEQDRSGGGLEERRRSAPQRSRPRNTRALARRRQGPRAGVLVGRSRTGRTHPQSQREERAEGQLLVSQVKFALFERAGRRAGTSLQVVWLPDPVKTRQVDQQEIITPSHGVNQVGTEAVEREQGQRGARRVVAAVGEQASDALQALQIAGSAASGGGLGLADQGDPSARRLRTLAQGEGDDVDLVLGTGRRVGDLGGADRARQAPGEERVCVAAGEDAGEVLEMWTQDLGVEGRCGGLPCLFRETLLDRGGLGQGDGLVEADDGPASVMTGCRGRRMSCSRWM